MSTTINIYLANPSPAATDGSSSSLPRNDAAATPANAQPIIINTGDFAQVNVIPPYAGHGQRGGVGSGRATDGAKWPVNQPFLDRHAMIGAEAGTLAQAGQRAAAWCASAKGAMASSAAMQAQAGKWVHAVRTLMNLAAGSEAATALQAGKQIHAFSESAHGAMDAFTSAAAHASRQVNACKEAASDALGLGAESIAQTNKQMNDLSAVLNDKPAAIPVPLFAQPQAWDPCQIYHPGDRVAYNGNVYQVPNVGGNHMSVEPGTNDSKWLYAGTVENNYKNALHQYVEEHLQG